MELKDKPVKSDLDVELITEPTKVRITEKQANLADAVVENLSKPKEERLNKTDLLKYAGYTDTSAKASMMELYSTKGFIEALNQRGVRPNDLVKVAQGAMQAKKGTFFRGEYIESDQLDHDTALKGAHFVADILGLKKTVNENRNINVNVGAEDIADLF